MSMSSSSPPVPTALTPQSEKHRPKRSRKSQAAPIASTVCAGQRLGDQWEILEKLGRGGMADVFRAFSKVLRLERVVKVLVLDRNANKAELLRKRFEWEASVLARVSHPHLVKAFSFCPTTPEEPAFFTMEHIRGVSLKQLTDLPLPGEKRQHGGGPLSEERALQIMIQICEAIMALHEAGVYHRDLKPGNIMLSQRNGRDHATLIDLGICKCTAVWYADLEQRTPVEQRFETEPDRDLGTPGFMGAGENADLVSRDVFGFCATLFKIVLGRTPYQLEPKPGEVLQWRPADDERISESLKLVLERGLQADPAIRYPSVARLHEELGYVLQEVADEPSDYGESDPRPAASKDKDAPRDRNDAWILEPVHAALDVARQRLEHAAQETDGVEAALPEPVSITTVPELEREREPAAVDGGGREASIAENEIDGAKAAPLATTVPELELGLMHAVLDDRRREGEELAASEIDGAKAALLAETAVLEREAAVVGDASQEAKHGENEIDSAKAAAVGETAVLEREPTGEAAKPRRFVRRVVVGALACVSIGLGWYFLGGTPAAEQAAAGVVAERATEDAHREAVQDLDRQRAMATPAVITPKEDDARSSGLRRPVAEPTTPSHQHALTKFRPASTSLEKDDIQPTPAKAKPAKSAKQRELKKVRGAALTGAREVLQRCLQNPENPVTITIGVTADGSLAGVLFSAPNTLRAIEKTCLRVRLKDVLPKAGHAPTKHRLQLGASESS